MKPIKNLEALRAIVGAGVNFYTDLYPLQGIAVEFVTPKTSTPGG